MGDLFIQRRLQWRHGLQKPLSVIFQRFDLRFQNGVFLKLWSDKIEPQVEWFAYIKNVTVTHLLPMLYMKFLDTSFVVHKLRLQTGYHRISSFVKPTGRTLTFPSIRSSVQVIQRWSYRLVHDAFKVPSFTSVKRSYRLDGSWRSFSGQERTGTTAGSISVRTIRIDSKVLSLVSNEAHFVPSSPTAKLLFGHFHAILDVIQVLWRMTHPVVVRTALCRATLMVSTAKASFIFNDWTRMAVNCQLGTTPARLNSDSLADNCFGFLLQWLTIPNIFQSRTKYC